MHWLRSSLAVLACAFPASAADWPQWLGPNRDGSSPDVVAPWKGKPKVLWRQPVGEGNSSPVVTGGRVFVHARVKDKDAEDVTAFDASTGKELWRTAYDRPAFLSLYGNGPRATPAVSVGKVYSFGITGILTCLDAASGKQIWQVDTSKKFSPPRLAFGAACSPVAEGGRVLVNVGAKGASVVAFDQDTGKVGWKALDDPASYSSPIVFGEGTGRQAVFFTGRGIASLNPSDGTRYWEFPLVDKLLESSTTPVRVGGRLLASSITYGSVALDLQNKDGKPAYKEAWKNTGLTSYFSTPVAADGDHVLLVTGSNPLAFQKARATLHCVDMRSGKTTWSKPDVGEYHAALLRTGDGKVLLLEEAGDLVLLDPHPNEYRELARSRVCGHVWAHPALSDGKLYLRDDHDVICVEPGR